MAAFILRVPGSTAHIGILSEIGWPSIASLIYKMKMNYFSRLTYLKDTFLVKQVFNECFANNTAGPQQDPEIGTEFISNLFNPYVPETNQSSTEENQCDTLLNCKKNWKSKYEAEIGEIMTKCTITPPERGKKGKNITEQQINKWDISVKKEKCLGKSSLKWQPHLSLERARQPYINGSNEAQIIAKFRLGNAISQQEKKEKTCILCRKPDGNNEAHLLMSCPLTEHLRNEEKIYEWLQSQKLLNESDDIKLRHYLGEDGSTQEELLIRSRTLTKFITTRIERA